MTDSRTAREAIPVTLLTGFLGSGKTTLLNRILTERHDERIAVIVNEYGDVGIDGSLVIGATDEIIELANGCVCCTVRGDLSNALQRLLAARDRRVFQQSFDRIVIEASGLAEPGPIVQTLIVDPSIAERVQLDGILTLTHAGNLPHQLDQHPEASEQVAYGDRVLLNHADRCTTNELQAARAAVRSLNSLAEVIECERGCVDLANLLDIATHNAERWTDLPTHSPDEHAHHSEVSSIAFETDAPLDLHRLKIWLQFLANRRGQDLYRLKGILACKSVATSVIVQGMFEWLEIGPGEGPAPPLSKLVMIGRSFDRAELERGWVACRAD